MRIAIGAIFGVRGGPARYARELVQAVTALPGQHEVTVICDHFPEDIPAGGVADVIEIPIARVWEQGLWDQRVGRVLRKRRFDLYHGTKGVLPLGLGVPAVVTVHDLAAFHQPSTFALLQRWHQRVFVPWSVRVAHRVIVDSVHAGLDLQRTLAVPRSKIRVVPLAASAVFQPRSGEDDDGEVLERLGIRRPYILYAGTLQPRKNVELLVAAFADLRMPGVDLVVAGRCRPGYRPAFLRRPPPGLRYLGEVSDPVLATLYRHALAFCSPSGYEGFGLSLLEALSCGCPVIAPRHTSIPEVVGDAALFLSDMSAAAVREALHRICQEPELRARLRLAGLRQARQFSWEATAAATLAVYREVVHA